MYAEAWYRHEYRHTPYVIERTNIEKLLVQAFGDDYIKNEENMLI